MNDYDFDCDLNLKVKRMIAMLEGEDNTSSIPRDWLTIGFILNRIERDKAFKKLKEGIWAW